jgi:hypothetical protein
VLLVAIRSLPFTLYTGRHNGSVVLIGLFVIRVVSPFAALIFVKAPRSLAMAAVLTIASLMIYGVIAPGPPRAQPASLLPDDSRGGGPCVKQAAAL